MREPGVDLAARRSLTALDSSSLRAGASPSQKGMVGGAPCASATRTVPERHLQNPPRRVAKLKDVAGDRLDGEVLVQRADERLFRVEDDAEVGDLGNGAAGCLRQQPAAAPARAGSR